MQKNPEKWIRCPSGHLMHRRNPWSMYYRCTECGVSFPNPRRSPEEFAQRQTASEKAVQAAAAAQSKEADADGIEAEEEEEYTTILERWRQNRRKGREQT